MIKDLNAPKDLWTMICDLNAFNSKILNLKS